MNIEMIVRRFAGVFILVSVTLAYTVHINWLLLAVFVGLNLFQSSFTGFCPLQLILQKMEKRRGITGTSQVK